MKSVCLGNVWESLFPSDQSFCLIVLYYWYTSLDWTKSCITKTCRENTRKFQQTSVLMRDKLINVTKERDHIALMCVKVEKVSGICRYRNGTNTLPSILSEKPQGTKCSLKSSSVQIVSDSRGKKYQMFSQGIKNHQKVLFKRTKCTLLYMYFFLSFFEKRTD